MITQKSLRGLRILVVEDEAMIVMLLEDMLSDLGCELIGPAYKIDEALALIQSERFDGAILDVNLAGERTTPLADILQSKGIPLLFATGYGNAGVNDAFRGRPVLTKPFTQNQLEEAMRSLFAASERLPERNA
jgi:CheY-like chemotaxis protein